MPFAKPCTLCNAMVRSRWVTDDEILSVILCEGCEEPVCRACDQAGGYTSCRGCDMLACRKCVAYDLFEREGSTGGCSNCGTRPTEAELSKIPARAAHTAIAKKRRVDPPVLTVDQKRDPEAVTLSKIVFGDEAKSCCIPGTTCAKCAQDGRLEVRADFKVGSLGLESMLVGK